MTVATAATVPAKVRIACFAVVLFLFAMPTLAGRLTTYFVYLFAILALLTPDIRSVFATRSRNPIDLLFLVGALLPALAFVFTSEEARDLLFVFNFAPILLAIPFRWQVERLARTDGAEIIGWLSLAGTAIGLAVAVVQVVILGMERAGQPIMSAFHFANTVMLLGFLAPAGLFGAARGNPILLAGPAMGILAVVISGTRGALLAAPILVMLLLGFVLYRSANRKRVLLLSLAGLAAGLAALLVANQLGYTRAFDGFHVAAQALLGGKVDSNANERLVMFAGGWRAFLNSPLVGYGWPDMVEALLPYVPTDMVELMKSFRQLHNGLLSFAVGAGVPGIVSFVILSVAPVIGVLDTPRDQQFGARLYMALALCATYAVCQLTIIMIGFEFHTTQYAFMAMVFLGLARSPGGRADAQSVSGKASESPETAKTA